MVAAGDTGDRGPFAFGEKILNLLDQGRFTSTYKYAVLLSLVDLCLENPKADGSAPDTLATSQLADKIVEVYWPHTATFAGQTKAKVLLYSVKSRRPHLVTNGGEDSTTFFVLQGVGEYDFVPLLEKNAG